MNTATIDAATWTRLREEHPQAYALLADASIRGEYRALVAEEASGHMVAGRAEWVRARLADLRAVDAAFPALTPITGQPQAG